MKPYRENVPKLSDFSLQKIGQLRNILSVEFHFLSSKFHVKNGLIEAIGKTTFDRNGLNKSLLLGKICDWKRQARKYIGIFLNFTRLIPLGQR